MYYDVVETGKRIKEMRRMNKLTQEQVADELGTSCQTVCNIETGKRGASIDSLVILSELFGCSLDYLVKGRDSSKLNIHIPEEKRDFAEKMLKAILDNM